jgi:DnaJ-class molecular chaperone
MYDQVGDEGMKSGGDGMEHGDIPDFFNHIFGRRGAAESNRSNNSVYPLNVALEDFYNGCVRKIRITRNVVCAECKGKGGKGDDVKKCMECNGNGVIRIRRQVGPGMIQEMQMPCKKCRGVGTLIPDHARCKVCKGNKVVEQSKTLEVVISKGMRENESIIFKGESDEVPGKETGDLVVVLHQKPHDVFQRHNVDLVMEKHISLYEALVGFSFLVKHLDGRMLYVKSEDGVVTNPGDVKCISGEGMPTNRGRNGNMYIEFVVDFPVYAELNIAKLKELVPDMEVENKCEGAKECVLEPANVQRHKQEDEQRHQPQCQHQ